MWFGGVEKASGDYGMSYEIVKTYFVIFEYEDRNLLPDEVLANFEYMIKAFYASVVCIAKTLFLL